MEHIEYIAYIGCIVFILIYLDGMMVVSLVFMFELSEIISLLLSMKLVVRLV